MLSFAQNPAQPTHVHLVYGPATTQVYGASGVAGMPDTMQTTTAAEIHPHDQARHEPLASVEGFSLGFTLALYGGIYSARRLRGSMGSVSRPAIADSS